MSQTDICLDLLLVPDDALQAINQATQGLGLLGPYLYLTRRMACDAVNG